MTKNKSKEQLKTIISECFNQWTEKKPDQSPEIEVRFGTKGIKPISKIDYENVIKKLLSNNFQFWTENYTLKIESQFLDVKTGRYQRSNIRVEIIGLAAIQEYCKTNNLQEVVNKHNVQFVRKQIAKTKDGEKIEPADFSDFNFRVNYSIEETLNKNHGSVKELLQTWMKVKKTFRYLCRSQFTNSESGFDIDLSYVRSSSWNKKINRPLLTYSVQESNVFNNPISYEIEAEMKHPIYVYGDYKLFNSIDDAVKGIEFISKLILSGLQKTNFPISYSIQKKIMKDIMKLIHEDWDESSKIYPSMFLGPSSKTLQIENIIQSDNNFNVPNIRTNFVVTEKADGIRHLLYISDDGKIYLKNMNMELMFTGAYTDELSLANTILDGELILHDKIGNFINLFACFDIYYLNKKDIRHLPFIDSKEGRLSLMQKTISLLSLKMVTKKENDIFVIRSKKFYPNEPEKPNMIFGACNLLLKLIDEGQYTYNTDGLIFTSSNYGVGSSQEGVAGPKKKIGWEYSLKWKPPAFNTIDFLVTSIKDKNNQDLITQLFENGKNVEIANQITQYKTLVLRCGFDEKKHGFINPCQDLLDEKWTKNTSESNDYKPVRFYPTLPEDNDAGIVNVLLEEDSSGKSRMYTEEREVFESDSIVEFRYDQNKEKKWRWIPLRVREDKTAEYRAGLKNYGNDYSTANNNWYSIHNPITEEMLKTGQNIPIVSLSEDIYYNRKGTESVTKGLRQFHNLYVKKKLIVNIGEKSDSLIDLACGKGGDLQKWIDAKLKFVLGIDKSKDNIENRLDGACARYLNVKKKVKSMPYGVFLNGTSDKNVKSGKAFYTDKSAIICKALFGTGGKTSLPSGIQSRYGIAVDGFDICSCQFAIHYMFKDKETLNNFIRNVSECTKLNGYFIGTTYDGKTIFDKLSKIETSESINIFEKGKKIWEIIKLYDKKSFPNDQTCLNYEIEVYQETINQKISEYLVNFDYLTRIMENYGFSLIDTNEAKELGFPSGSASFEVLFNQLQYESKNPKIKKDFEVALNMNSYEKEISFLNRYFIFKKVRHVDTEKIMMNAINELADQTLYEEEKTEETQKVIEETLNKENNEEEKKTKSSRKPKRKTKKTLELIIED